ncbi:NAD(P)-binding protein [Daldinia caldariorum]|uniref:NAD(P)-binding protein n=1 Tax=Daldinia caldariorum TaxID=326644 RepID=UPI002007C7AD|nr:NAD(P)-binding protein [Daldinia caldariorum]KAI1469379.1 NAD(P)-binding protein [Daldinia caldariorum]
MASTIVLISGANRGIGKALAERYLALPNHTVIAANRDPKHPTSKDMEKLPKGPESKLILVKVEATSDTDAADAVKELQDQGIDHLDIVIANSGITFGFTKAVDAKVEDMRRVMEVNVYGVLRLFQATLPLIRKAAAPKFVTIGSGAGSIEEMYPYPNAVYGPSKAAVHWLTKSINEDEDHIIAFVIDPGWTQTEMGDTTAQSVGLDNAPITVAESCDGSFKVINEATRESGGKLWTYNGRKRAW